jgi:hypothetical protein
MNTFMGIRVVEVPGLEPKPCIEVRDIKLKDGTPLLSRAFLSRENSWWKDRFGVNEVAYFFNSGWAQGIVMSPKTACMLRNFVRG